MKPFAEEIRLMPYGGGSGSCIPRGWAQCSGQLLSISQYQPLFSLLGNPFGVPSLRAEMAAVAALDGSRPAGTMTTGRLCAVQVAHAPATTTAVAELQLPHPRRLRARVA